MLFLRRIIDYRLDVSDGVVVLPLSAPFEPSPGLPVPSPLLPDPLPLLELLPLLPDPSPLLEPLPLLPDPFPLEEPLPLLPEPLPLPFVGGVVGGIGSWSFSSGSGAF